MIPAWKVFYWEATSRGKVRLASVIAHYRYEGPVAARRPPMSGMGPAHASSFADERLGFYAWKNLGRAVFHMLHQTTFPATHLAIADVSLFGTVIEHEHGYRAQALRFDRIYIPVLSLHVRSPSSDPTELVHSCTRRYACDVYPWKTAGGWSSGPTVFRRRRNPSARFQWGSDGIHAIDVYPSVVRRAIESVTGTRKGRGPGDNHE